MATGQNFEEARVMVIMSLFIFSPNFFEPYRCHGARRGRSKPPVPLCLHARLRLVRCRGCSWGTWRSPPVEVRRLGEPVGERNFLVMRTLEHRHQDDVVSADVLDVMAKALRHIADITRLEL